MEKGEIVYLDGRFLPAKEARVFPKDSGFLHGYGIFETLRAYEGKPFFLPRHVQRLRNSASALQITFPIEEEEVERVCHQLLGANKLSEARIRITLSGGELSPEFKPVKPALLISASPFTPPPEEVYRRKGYKAIISKIRRNPSSPLPFMKSLSYLENILALKEAVEKGAQEALLLDQQGFLTEGARTNIFLAKGNKLMTPAVEEGLLPGITRELVMELAEEKKIKVAEGKISLEELFSAEEAFLTNSLLEIMPLTEISGNPIPGPGELTISLLEAYRRKVQTMTLTE